MKTFIADIIPKIQKFSKKLDALTKLTNQHWVSLDDIGQSKKVYIFRPNNQLLTSENGLVEKGSWEYLGNQSLLIDTKNESYLLKHGFFDENVMALKLDSTNKYAFFINETKYDHELNNINDIINFLSNKYINESTLKSGLGKQNPEYLYKKTFGYKILSQENNYDFAWGKYLIINVEFNDGLKAQVYKGGETQKFFYLEGIANVKVYCTSLDEAIKKVYEVVKNKSES